MLSNIQIKPPVINTMMTNSEKRSNAEIVKEWKIADRKQEPFFRNFSPLAFQRGELPMQIRLIKVEKSPRFIWRFKLDTARGKFG